MIVVVEILAGRLHRVGIAAAPSSLNGPELTKDIARMRNASRRGGGDSGPRVARWAV
jgi:hypothetical protein